MPFNSIDMKSSNNITIYIEIFDYSDTETIRTLVGEFVSTHNNTSFRQNYWTPFKNRLNSIKDDPECVTYVAKAEDQNVAFINGRVEYNGQLH